MSELKITGNWAGCLAEIGRLQAEVEDHQERRSAYEAVTKQEIERLTREVERLQHQWGSDTEYRWYQSCGCSVCARETRRIAAMQLAILSQEPKP